jgi:hypothetical protein
VGTCLAALGGCIPLWLTVLLHEGSTLLVALNSMRLLLPDFSKKYVVWVGVLSSRTTFYFPKSLIQ